jgi:hypothetical protein
MKCLFLSGKYMLSCKALREVYVPSSFEIDEYCKSIQHRMCPFYIRRDGEPNPGTHPASKTR